MAWSTKNLAGASLDPHTFPDSYIKLGDAEGWWFEPETGIAVIRTVGGTVDDRWLLEGILKDRLAAVGIRQATFAIDPSPDFQKTAQWTDIMAKAKRLVQSGNVQLLRNGYNNIVAHVVGDHGEYTSEISRDDPSSRAITQWTCECPWDQYAFQRTRQWKKYEARPCAHVLATYWKSLSTPIDEDLTPDQAGGMGTGQALPGGGAPPMQSPMGSPFDGGTFYPDGSQQLNPSQPQMMPGMGQEQTPLGQPGYDPTQVPPPQMMADPAQQSVIPPFPMDQSQMQLPVSVPGGRPGPYPANPLQQGGTLSAVARRYFHSTEATFKPGDIIHPAAQGYGDGWSDGCPGYDPNKVYIFDQRHFEHSYADPHYPNSLSHTYEVEPLGPVEQDPEGELLKQKYEQRHGHPFTTLYSDDGSPAGCPECVRDTQDAAPDGAEWYHDYNWRTPKARVVRRLDEWSPRQSKKGDTFLPDTSARVEEETLGQSEGREGAIDAGQWMNVPRGTNVVVVHQDPTTGWVECMMPLKGGPMTSYHVRFFIEPEKLTPLNRPNTPFQNPR